MIIIIIIIIVDVFVVSDIYECLNDPCLHDGNCSNTRGSYICTCVPEWTGNNCQTGNLPNTVSHFSYAPLIKCKNSRKRNVIFLF